jgi:iron complex outermembrane recepter protein
MKQNILYIFILFFYCVNSVKAQHLTIPTIITIKDAVDISLLDFATVRLMQDSVCTYAALSDSIGQVSIPQHVLFDKNGYIAISRLGYKDTTLNSSNIPADGVVYLKRNMQSTVVITAKKRVLRLNGSKLSLTVSDLPNAAQNSGLEILKLLPGIKVSPNLSVLNDPKVLLLVNGQDTGMSGGALNAFMETLDAETIERIEINYAPGAEYDAATVGKVINLILNNTSNKHVFRMQSEWLHNYLLTPSYRWDVNKKQFKFFGTLYAPVENTVNIYHLNAEILAPAEASTLAVNTFNRRRNHEANSNISFEFQPNTRWKTGMSVYQLYRRSTRIADNNSFQVSGNRNEYIVSNDRNTENIQRYNINFFTEVRLDTADSKASFNINRSFYVNLNQTHLPLQLYVDNIASAILPYDYESHNRYQFTSISTDVYKKRGIHNVRTGVKISLGDHNNNQAFNIIEKGLPIQQSTEVNNFYQETNIAAYLKYSTSIKKWDINGGVRYEYFIPKFTANRMIVPLSRYDNYFPSASVSYPVNDQHQISVSYQRTLSRPNFRYLDPTIYYAGFRNLSQGNPNLRPSIQSELLLSWLFNFQYSLNLYGRVTDAAIAQFPYKNMDGTFVFQSTNLPKNTEYGVNITLPHSFNERLEAFLNLEGKYQSVDNRFQALGGQYDLINFNFFSSLNFQTFHNGPKAELSLFYMTPQIQDAFKIGSISQCSFELSYQFKQKPLTIKMGVNDIFNGGNPRIVILDPNQRSNVFSQNFNRKIVFSLRYVLGNRKLEDNEQRDTGNQDELKRMGKQ